MASLTAGTTFTDGVANDVTAAKLGALVNNATVNPGIIQDRTAETVVGVDDNILISDASDSNNLKRMTVANLLKAPLVSTSGTVDNLTTGTTTSTAQIVTSGTTATFNSTTGTITNLSATTSTFLGTITGSTNVVNIGSGQIYKDASGNVGIGTASPTAKLDVNGGNIVNTTTAAGTTGLSLSNGTAGAGISCDFSASNTYLDIKSKLFIRDSASAFATRMNIDSSGRVGINVTSPLYKLQVDGDVALTDTSSLYWATAGGTTRASIIGDSSGNLKLQTGGSNTERLRIDSDGKVDASGELEAKNVTVNVNTLSTASGTQNLDFTSEGYLTHAITGNITYTASNYAAGRSLSIRITCDGTQRNLTFPAGWVFVGSKPTAIAASKVAVLSITSFGATEANTVAAYAVQT